MDNKLQPQVQQQQQQQHAKQTTNASRWREKEAEMQNRLTEREKEIGRLKEKLRDLTKKLQQEQQHYNSKVRTFVVVLWEIEPDGRGGKKK